MNMLILLYEMLLWINIRFYDSSVCNGLPKGLNNQPQGDAGQAQGGNQGGDDVTDVDYEEVK